MGSKISPLTDIPQSIAMQAVEFMVDLQTGSDPVGVQEKIEQWRQQDADHDRAWRHIENANRHFISLNSSAINSPTAKQLAQSTLTSAPAFSRRETIKALSVLLFGGGSAWLAVEQTPWQAWTADESTAVGEQRSLAFAGYDVTMNTDTALNLHKRRDGNKPELRLVRGEVLISTPAETQSRLVVKVDGLECWMVSDSASFSLQQLDDHCRLMVLDGRVDLYSLASAKAPFDHIVAGQQVMLAGTKVVAKKAADKSALAWKNGMLIASSMRLDDFLLQVNRYRRGKLRCAPEIAGLKVSGSYPLGDTDRILSALEVSLPIKMHYLTRYFVTAQPLNT